jgi:FMN phosphatase YigB (HAD superfamily)
MEFVHYTSDSHRFHHRRTMTTIIEPSWFDFLVLGSRNRHTTRHMAAARRPNIKAVIVSVYGTILEKMEPQPDADARWQALWHERFGEPARLDLAALNAATDAEVARKEALMLSAGISNPVAFWPRAVMAALPELQGLPAEARHDFLYTYAQLRSPTRAVAGAVLALRKMHRWGLVLGIVSNGYPHTAVELALALENNRGLAAAFLPVGLEPGHTEQAAVAAAELSIFTRPLCFWGFAHGFGKPDPHVFCHLTTRLGLRDISPEETLIVGDSETADLAPARALGWQTWQLAPRPITDVPHSGNWFSVTEWLGLE